MGDVTSDHGRKIEMEAIELFATIHGDGTGHDIQETWAVSDTGYEERVAVCADCGLRLSIVIEMVGADRG